MKLNYINDTTILNKNTTNIVSNIEDKNKLSNNISLKKLNKNNLKISDYNSNKNYKK